MQTGLMAVGCLVILGLLFALGLSRADIKGLELALRQEQDRCKALSEAREADKRALATLMQAEQEARRAIDERQKYIDTIHGALNGTGLLDALRMFGEAVCSYDPAAKRVTCTDATPGSTGGDTTGKERAGVDGSGCKAD